MTRTMSREGLDKLTKPWEEFVGYPYDDKRPKVRVNGKLQYPEWMGEQPRGTITIGYGHTDAAGAIKAKVTLASGDTVFGVAKIEVGMRITEEEAETLLLADMAPCEAHVNKYLKVDVTQHEYDAVCDTDFNCPSAIPHVCSLINAGRKSEAPGVLLEYVNSKGERMAGLVNRRNAEIKWFNTPDNPDDAEVQEVFSPKAEREPPPKSQAQSKVIAGAATIGAGGIFDTVNSLNQYAEPLKQAKQNLNDLGVLDQFVAFSHSPLAGGMIGVGIVAIAAFIYFDRRSKLLNDHV